jgi:hypothetical protein
MIFLSVVGVESDQDPVGNPQFLELGFDSYDIFPPIAVELLRLFKPTTGTEPDHNKIATGELVLNLFKFQDVSGMGFECPVHGETTTLTAIAPVDPDVVLVHTSRDIVRPGPCPFTAVTYRIVFNVRTRVIPVMLSGPASPDTIIVAEGSDEPGHDSVHELVRVGGSFRDPEFNVTVHVRILS